MENLYFKVFLILFDIVSFLNIKYLEHQKIHFKNLVLYAFISFLLLFQ